MKTGCFVTVADVGRKIALGSVSERLSEVSEERREKILRLQDEREKRLSLGAGLLLKHAAAEYGVPEDRQSLLYGENGKPYFKDFPEAAFNLSHSVDRIACALSDRPVGVDIEQIREPNYRVAYRFFCEDEQARLKGGDAAEFFRIWTRKEAVMKATGEGFLLSPRSFAVVERDGRLHAEARGKTSDETAKLFEEDRFVFDEWVEDGYVVTVCRIREAGEELRQCRRERYAFGE